MFYTVIVSYSSLLADSNLFYSEEAEGDLDQLEVVDVLVLEVGLELHLPQGDGAGEEDVHELTVSSPSAQVFYLGQLGGEGPVDPG